MTASAAVTLLLTAGAGQVASVAWHYWALVCGWFVLVQVACLIAHRANRTWQRRQAVPYCPWCSSRYCDDPRLCICEASCGRMSCKAEEAALRA